MLSFLKPYWLVIVKWGAIVVGGLSLYFSIRNSGRDAERVKNMEDSLEQISKAKDIRRGVTSSGISANDRLRQRWTRK